MAEHRITDLAVCVASGICRLCFMLVVAGAALVPHANGADEAVSDDNKARKEILDLLLRQPALSFDTTPVRFYINDTLFAVPRNMIVHMPEHIVERSDAPSGVANLSNRVTLHVILADLAGLTETNVNCYLRGSDCELLVRVSIDTNHTGRAYLPREREAEFYLSWGGTPTEVASDLLEFPPLEGYGTRYFLGRLTPTVSLPFRCNVPEYFAPLCRITTGLEPGRGTINIFFNKSRWRDWRQVYEGVQRLIASFRVEK